MNLKLVTNFLGILLITLGGILLIPWGISLIYREKIAGDFLISAVLTASLGLGLYLLSRTPKRDLGIRDSFLVVSAGWIAAGLVGALPYFLSDILSNPFDAIFENISGFTTTGATVFSSVESLPQGLLLWRSLSQWLGGMGIIILSVAVLPFFRTGGMQLYEAEFPGPIAERISPRIADTARSLWRLYLGFTLLEILLLRLGGMSWFESLCQALTTMATGGFSTRTNSIAAFNSLYLELVIIIFMIIAGTNFLLHYRFIFQKRVAYLFSEEHKFYLALLLGTSIIISIFLAWQNELTFPTAFRQAVFQVVSIMTTTGYSSADYTHWPFVTQFLLLLLMLIGGCAGSTGGGIKVSRILIMGKQMLTQFINHIHPRAVLSVHLNRQVIEAEVISAIFAFTGIYFLILAVVTIIIASLGFDLITSISAVASAIGNVGPGLGLVGPAENYSIIPDIGKMALAIAMLLGRLEIYTLAVLFFPAFWRD